MDILFDDTSIKPKRKNKAFSRKSTGFSMAKEKKPVLDLFGGEDIFKKPEKKPAEKPKTVEHHKVEKKEEDPEVILKEFLDLHPDILPFIHIQPFTEYGLTPEQIHERISTIATESFMRIQQCSPIILKTTAKIEKSFTNIHNKYGKQNVPPGASLRCIGLHYLRYNLRLKRVELIKKNLDKISDDILFISNLVNIFSSNHIKKELKVLVQKIELAITEFPEKDPEYNELTRTIKAIDKLVQEPENVDYSAGTIISMALKLFNPTSGYFPDYGEVEGLFALSINSLSNEQKALIEKRINVSRDHPNAIGKAILTQSNDYMKHFGLDPSKSLQVIFILFARYFFVRLYETGICENILHFDNSIFVSKIKRLRKISPIGFGFSGNFLPENLKGIQLDSFPIDNPYKEAIGLFELTQFHTCPLDFCKSVHNALKEIQSVASEISFKTKTDENGGKVYAKSDHLLCLDDLFDISLIVLLLSAPVALQAIVEQFEPFIESLEMTADLEFAFTNVSAMVRHIIELDLDKFIEEAEKRARQALEIDPLRILA